MSDRNKAIKSLRALRDRFIERITQTVNETEEWDDGYSAAEDQLIDLGEKLWRINHILGNMPEEPTPAEATFTNPNLGKPHEAARSFVITQGVPLPTWDDFIREIEAENRNEAARILGVIAQLEPALAFQATNIFAAQYAIVPDFKGKARSLRVQLRANMNGSLSLIHELFGIQGSRAQAIYNSLKAVV